MESVIIQTKDPTFASKCKKHNVHYNVDTDESGYDIYLLVGSYEDIRDFSGAPVIFLTAKDGVLDRIKGLNLGADDYIVKPFILPNLLARMEALLRRTSWQKSLPAGGKKPDNSAPSPEQTTLTAREKDVLQLAAQGANNKEIAEKLVLREVTVKTHLNSIFKKLKVTNRTQAVLLAMQMNLINQQE